MFFQLVSQNRAFNVDLMGFLVFLLYLANHGAKDELKGATPISIRLQRFTLYTLVSFGSNYSPTIQIYAYVRASNQTL